MRKLLPHIYWPIFISGTILILILGLVGLWLVLYPTQSQLLGSLLSRPFQSVEISSASSVEIYREQNMLKLSFYIDDADQEAFRQLSLRLGISDQWQQGIGIGLDQQSLGYLERFLPLKSGIKIEGDKITLSGGKFSFLQSAGGGERKEFATGSGKLHYLSGQNGAELMVDQPAELLHYATTSGELNLSKKIESQLFSLAAKIDRIELEVKGKSLEGEIVFK